MSRKHTRLVALTHTHVSIHITRTKDVLMLIRDTGIILIMLLALHLLRAQGQHTRCTSIVDIG